MLFVPGDSEKKLAKCDGADADALIIDLEDSVEPDRKPHARRLAVEYLEQRRDRRRGIWVRVNALGDTEFRKDLERTVAARPDGIVLPKPQGPDDVSLVARRLAQLETRYGIEPGATKILPIATETPAGVFAAEGYRRCGERLAALGWGAEDLSVALGAATNVDEHGEWLPPYQLARSICLLAAAAAGVRAIDTVYTDLRDAEGLRRQAAAAKRDGFAGKMAIHPDQVGVLNRIFSPDPDEIAHARRVVEAFETAEGLGVLGVVTLDGKMLDRPHLIRARRTLRLAASLSKAAATHADPRPPNGAGEPHEGR
ncbi:MAG: CoA ester lyase [Gammaproteobacteria bacterium]|nr:CoA ester lyase [Gammaproteobacteria bacterium]